MTPDPNMPDPYEDYDPERAKFHAIWLGISLAALLIVSGLIYLAAHREENLASNNPATTTTRPLPSGTPGNPAGAGRIQEPKEAPSTTGSGSSSR